MYKHGQKMLKKICGLCSHTSHTKKQLVSFLCIIGCPFLSFRISLFRVVRLFACVLQDRLWIAMGFFFRFFFRGGFFLRFFYLFLSIFFLGGGWGGLFVFSLCAFLPVIKRHDFDNTQLISSLLCIIYRFTHSPSSNSAAHSRRSQPPLVLRHRPLQIHSSPFLINFCFSSSRKRM